MKTIINNSKLYLIIHKVFLFELLLACITTKIIEIILNSKEDLLLCMSLSQASDYIKNKIWCNFKTYNIDKKSRQKSIPMR